MQGPEHEEEAEFDIPVREARDAAMPAAADVPADGPDWTRTESVRDDPESLGEEARRLWDALRSQFVEPILRDHPEVVGHLSSAGAELASALRTLIRGSEQAWADGAGPGRADPPVAPDIVEVFGDETPGEQERQTDQA